MLKQKQTKYLFLIYMQHEQWEAEQNRQGVYQRFGVHYLQMPTFKRV